MVKFIKKNYINSAMAIITFLVIAVFLNVKPFGFVYSINIPSPKDKFYVNDFANVLSEKTQDYIYKNSTELYGQTTAQIVVVTVPSLDGEDIENYSLELGRKWGVGSKKENNGLLILLAPNERKVRISVGRGLEGRINDGKAGRIFDQYGIQYFKQKEWDEGILKVFTALVNEVYKEYDKTPPETLQKSEVKNSFINGEAILIIIALIFLLFLFLNKSLRRATRSSGCGFPLIFWGPLCHTRSFSDGFFRDSDGCYNGGSDNRSDSGGGGSFDGGGASRDF
ncbi:MAG: TPM domain-containing protein [Oscillospiraceae bacterium]|jgi:uncharacterized protein|nr:TPM domain-containing protein [Oscillospiraceae bacterium]